MKINLAARGGVLAGLGLILAFAGKAPAVNVTYNVDMSEQIAQGNFNPGSGDTVYVAGTFATSDGSTWLQTATDGATNYILQPSGTNADVYTGTFNITNAVTTFEEHKFVINPGGSFASLMWESNNRFFQVPATATNLPTVYWNDVAPGSTVVTPITFQVDMSVQTQLGNFHPQDGDLVFVAGDWNWTATGTPMTQDTTDTNVWTTTVNLTNVIGTTVNYKFLYIPFVGNTTWENNDVGPGGGQNRQFSFPGTATNLPLVYFNNLTPTSSVVIVPVTFQVNLAVQIALGTFNPVLGDTVAVSGDGALVSGWDPSALQLTQSPDNPNLYVGTYNVTNTPGSTLYYKFVANGGQGGLSWEANNVGPGGAQNRLWVITNTPTTLAPVYWNNVGALGSLSISNNAGQADLHWTAGPRIRLQSTTDLINGWVDVPNTQGSNSATVNISGQTFFRLIGP